MVTYSFPDRVLKIDWMKFETTRRVKRFTEIYTISISWDSPIPSQLSDDPSIFFFLFFIFYFFKVSQESRSANYRYIGKVIASIIVLVIIYRLAYRITLQPI